MPYALFFDVETVTPLEKLLEFVFVLSLSASPLAFAAEPVSKASEDGQCEALATADFSAVEDAPTQITEATSIAAKEQLPAYCRVKGYVAPNVGFELLIPDAWNGKFMHIGSGGYGGATDPSSCSSSLARGYACLTSDMGHQSTMMDATWGWNNLQAEVDWGYRATHVATLAGKAIAERYYRKKPTHSYYLGCSTGGRQGLQAAQRFPWDFDGIIAGAPPTRISDIYVALAWGQRALRSGEDKPMLGVKDLKLLTDAALARCDMDDGIKDGIIGAPLSCVFQPAQLRCKPGQTEDCLTSLQVKAAERIYEGPTTSDGRRLLGHGAPPGSELGGAWNVARGGNWGIFYGGAADKPSAFFNVTLNGFRYLIFSPDPGPSWNLDDFDFDRDYKRLDVMQTLYNSDNPDLSRFQAAGGKLLIYHGLNDLAVLPQSIIDYYQKLERVVGSSLQTQAFVRLFSLPGVEHCTGGLGADRADWLTAMEQWVEESRAPDRLVAHRLKATAKGYSAFFPSFPILESEIEMSRPIYPWPARAHFDGQGDSTKASSFYAIAPKAEAAAPQSRKEDQ